MAGINLLFSATDDNFSRKTIDKLHFGKKRLLEMLSVAENNRMIPAIDKLDN